MSFWRKSQSCSEQVLRKQVAAEVSSIHLPLYSEAVHVSNHASSMTYRTECTSRRYWQYPGTSRNTSSDRAACALLFGPWYRDELSLPDSLSANAAKIDNMTEWLASSVWRCTELDRCLVYDECTGKGRFH